MNGRIPAPASAENVGAISDQGGKIVSLYNPTYGDAFIGKPDELYLYYASDGRLYRWRDNSVYGIYDQGCPPWGNEEATLITSQMMHNCTSHEWGNCILTQRCGFAIVSLSGLELSAGVAASVQLPYISRFRCQAWLHDLGAVERGTMVYIDGGNNVLSLFPSPINIASGYCTLIYPIQ